MRDLSSETEPFRLAMEDTSSLGDTQPFRLGYPHCMTPSSENPQRQARGPELHDAVTASLTRAFFDELAESGYGRLSLESVARRAGSGKAAIYRRWPSKEVMTTDLVSKVAVGLAEVTPTDSLEGDVLAYLVVTRDALLDPRVARIFPDLLAARPRNPGLAAALLEGLREARRARALEILERGIERQELPAGLDTELALDVLAGPLYWGASVRGAVIDDARLGRLDKMIIAALRA